MARLLNALRDELVTAGIVRDPATAGVLPPFWRAPRLGIPAPGEGQGVEVGTDAVIGAYIVSGIPPGPHEGTSWRRRIVELRFRTTKGYQAEDLDEQIADQIIDRRNFDLGGGSGLRIIECQKALELQLLRSDEQGFEHLCQYEVWVYA